MSAPDPTAGSSDPPRSIVLCVADRSTWVQRFVAEVGPVLAPGEAIEIVGNAASAKRLARSLEQAEGHVLAAFVDRETMLSEPEIPAVLRTLLPDDVVLDVADVIGEQTAIVGAEVPWVEGALAAAVRERIDAVRDRRDQGRLETLRRVDILRDLPEERLLGLLERVHVRQYPANAVVVRAGERGDGLYFIQSGEVHVLARDVSAGGVVASLGPGEHFGEMSLVTGEPRANTVVTAAPSVLLFLGQEHWQALLEREPRLALQVSRALSERLRRVQDPTRHVPRLLVCHDLHENARGRGLGREIALAIAGESGRRVLLVDWTAPDPGAPERALARFLERATAGAGDVDPSLFRRESETLSTLSSRDVDEVDSVFAEDRLGAFLALAAKVAPFVVVATPASLDAARLSELAARTDRMLLVHASTIRSVAGVTTVLGTVRRTSPLAATRIDLVAEHSPEATVTGDEHGSGVEARAQYRLYRGPSAAPGEASIGVRRMVRRVLGIGVGLALGGGGARCAAQVGVLEVFERERVPIDLLSGTSAGSLIGGLFAMGKTAAEMLAVCDRLAERDFVADYTIPRTAIFKGDRFTRTLRRHFGDVTIEELPIEYVAVAADLVTGREYLFERGPLWGAVRASASPPGLLPPVRRGPRVLVDGAVSNNVPGDLLRKRGARVVIAVNVTPDREVTFVTPAHARPGPVGRLLRRLPAVQRFLDAPSIVQILLRSLDVQGLESVRNRAEAFDFHVRPAIADFHLMDWSNYRPIIQRGREAAEAALPAVLARVAELKAEL